MPLEPKHWLSLEEYHELERRSEVKYEYCDGRVYAMSGGTFNHTDVSKLASVLAPD